MDLFAKRYHPPGTSPGTLAAPGGLPAHRIRLIDYTESEYEEHEAIAAADCRHYLLRPTVTWVDVTGGADAEVLGQLGGLFGLHPLALEDVVNTGQRPKLDVHGDQLFVVMSLPCLEGGRVNVEQVSLFVSENVLVSFHSGSRDPFEPVRRRLRNRVGRIRARRADYLLYAVLDLLVDLAFPVLERMGEEIDDIEQALLDMPGREVLARIQQTKRELVLLRRRLWPQRDVVNELLRDVEILVSDETRVFLRDCYDHAVQVIDLLETYREMSAALQDVYLSSQSHRLNESMRVLTVIATLFIPLTFLVGVYGMNFGARSASPWAMPELDWYYGYPLLWGLMIAVAAGMLLYFRAKRWF